jgi:hypothetical protein
MAYEIFYARKVDLFDKIKEVDFSQIFPCVFLLQKCKDLPEKWKNLALEVEKFFKFNQNQNTSKVKKFKLFCVHFGENTSIFQHLLFFEKLKEAEKLPVIGKNHPSKVK